MFFKLSRYRKLSDEVTVDVSGRRLESKSLRLLPQVTGTFLHTIEDGDRLDHLAYKYYTQPRKWWRICDANPDFMSPQELLGKVPVVTERFPLTFSGAGGAPWATLLAHIARLVGVEDIRLADDEASVLITYNQMNIRATDLADAIEMAGFAVEQSQSIGRTGKQIVIPPDVVG
jgi:hypothetical protein